VQAVRHVPHNEFVAGRYARPLHMEGQCPTCLTIRAAAAVSSAEISSCPEAWRVLVRSNSLVNFNFTMAYNSTWVMGSFWRNGCPLLLEIRPPLHLLTHRADNPQSDASYATVANRQSQRDADGKWRGGCWQPCEGFLKVFHGTMRRVGYLAATR
jgi:hypothetical protein